MANFFGEQNCADGEYGYECSKGDFSCTLYNDSASCEVKNEYYCAGSFYDSWGCVK